MGEFKDAAHLIRLAGVFLLGLILFLIVRSVAVPKSFGRYGPFRGAALAELSSRPLAYAGHEACEGCHTDVAELKAKGVHKSINCESCHGPQAKHADDPVDVKPVLPDAAQLCIHCHSENIAKPAGFPQVNPKEHFSGQACNTCHKPHNPGFDESLKK